MHCIKLNSKTKSRALHQTLREAPGALSPVRVPDTVHDLPAGETPNPRGTVLVPDSLVEREWWRVHSSRRQIGVRKKGRQWES